MSANAGLFEENADGPIQIRIGRSLPRIEVVVGFLRVVKGSESIQSSCMIFSDGRRELEGSRWRQRIVARWNPGLEEEGPVRLHLVMVGQDIRFPRVKHVQAALAFGVLRQKPIAIQIKPVVVEPALRPGLGVLTMVGIANGLTPSVHVGPVCIGVLGRPAGAALSRQVLEHHR